MTINLRAAAPISRTQENLGPLAQLPGLWKGFGYNLIAVPNHQNGSIFRLILNPTDETIEFTPTGPVPNRGSVQNDITMFGVTYLQQVSDSSNNEPIHVEPGIWLHVPATTDPAASASVVRQSTIPHGDSLIAIGAASSEARAPNIAPVSTLPTPMPGKPALPLGYTDPYLNPANVPAGMNVQNPNQALVDALAKQQEMGVKCINTVNLPVDSKDKGGVLNIPFVVSNANATDVSAIFWIETMQRPDGSQFMQLQYTQTVLLEFDGVIWPHVSVATLLKQR